MKWQVNQDNMQICLMPKTKIAFVLEPLGGSFEVFAYPLHMEKIERGKNLGFATNEWEAKRLCYDHVFRIRNIREPTKN